MVDEKKYQEDYISNTIRAIRVRRFDEAANLIIKGIIGNRIHELRKNHKRSEHVNTIVARTLENKFTLLRSRSFEPKEAATQAFNETVKELMGPAPEITPKKTKRPKSLEQ